MFSFRLTETFTAGYTDRPVPWGFTDVAGNSFSELTFLDKYSRLKEDGSKESWAEVCERVTNGTYSIQKDHAKAQRLPWNDHKAQRSAQEFFDRLFHFKFTPPGRGLWVMGTPIVNVQRNSAALQNCAFVSTIGMKRDNAFAPFAFLMEASMLGVGVGFDTRGVERGWKIADVQSNGDLDKIVIPDTREGWVESTGYLVNTYLTLSTCEPRSHPVFDYSQIRPKGAPIRTFGGTAAGPEPLIELHEAITQLFADRAGTDLTSLDILDLGNLIGVCVVSGNVRRSAELAMGEDGDELFRQAKNYGTSVARKVGVTEEYYRVRDGEIVSKEIAAEDLDLGLYAMRGREVFEYDWVPGPADYRKTWGWMSNNSISVQVGSNYDPYVDTIRQNGEPGFLWMDVTRSMGRGIDGPDDRDSKAAGFNPCFHPDTIIETVDGPKRIADITEPTLVYTKGLDGKLTTSKASAAFLSRRDARTLRIELQNGDDLIVTPEHKIMLRDGTWVEARELTAGVGLERLCRVRRGWRYSGVRLASQSPAEQVMEHRLIWEAVYGPIPEGYDVDHINRDHHDNRIENLRLLPHGEHARLSRSQVPNDHQVHAPSGDFAPSGNHGKKLLSGAIDPPRATGWTNGNTVVSITEGPVTDVYDITVDETHCMIANGIVAHNCAEQPLEGGTNGQGECCTLVETYPTRCDDVEDYLRTLKFAYLYAKTVTLLPTHWAETNAIMQRNRRIGTSMSGIAEFADTKGLAVLREWSHRGYDTIRHYDRIYSEWLCVRESNRVTTVKPSGTVSLLVGVTPGAHWMPGGEYFLRAQRIASDSVLVPWLQMAGYTVEPDQMDPRRVVVYFPIHHPGRAESSVSMWEKAMLAVAMQRDWSDNAVSVTVSFNPETEGEQIPNLLRAIEGQVKSISFLPKGNKVYAQQPYQEITKEEYEAFADRLMRVDFSVLYKAANAQEALGESYCSTDRCEVPA